MDDGFRVTGVDSTSILFEKPVPVRVTKNGCEDKHMQLTIRVIMGLSTHHRTSKVLQVQLTNEHDAFFLYTMEVSEDEFQSLKVDQCILVDFSTFPFKFIELLEHCMEAAANDSPRFLAVLHVRAGDSNFSVVETNQFKHLSHISLCFRQGNDSTIKSYLASRIVDLKASNADLHAKLKRTLQSLERALGDVSNLSSELAQMRESNCGSLSELKSQLTLELAQVKEKAMTEASELKDRMEKERHKLETKLRQQCECQQERACDLERENRALLDGKHCLETRYAELRAKFDVLEREFEERQQECAHLRSENQTLTSEKNEADKMLNRHLLRLTALEQEVQDKSERICCLSSDLQGQCCHRENLESALAESKSLVDRAELKAATAASEVERCNHTIEKLQADLRAAKAKVKLKGQVASQQDCLLSERQASIDKSTAEIASLRHEICQLKGDLDCARHKADDAHEKYEEAQDTLKSNQQMIQWLNQQLTELQLGKPGSACPSRYLYRPATSYSTVRGAGTGLSSVGTLGGSHCAGYKSLYPGTSSYLSSVNMKTAGIGLSPGLSSTLSAVNSKIPSATTRPSGAPVTKVQYKPFTAPASSKPVCAQGSAGAAAAATNSMGSSSYCFWQHESSPWSTKQPKDAELPRSVVSPPRCEASSFADSRGTAGYKTSPSRCQASADSKPAGRSKSPPPRCQSSGSSPLRAQVSEARRSPCRWQTSGAFKSSPAFHETTFVTETRAYRSCALTSGSAKSGGNNTCGRAGGLDADFVPEGWLHPAQG